MVSMADAVVCRGRFTGSLKEALAGLEKTNKDSERVDTVKSVPPIVEVYFA